MRTDAERRQATPSDSSPGSTAYLAAPGDAARGRFVTGLEESANRGRPAITLRQRAADYFSGLPSAISRTSGLVRRFETVGQAAPRRRPALLPHGRGHSCSSSTAHGSIRQNPELPDLGWIGRGTIGRYGGATGVLCADPESSSIRAVSSRHGWQNEVTAPAAATSPPPPPNRHCRSLGARCSRWPRIAGRQIIGTGRVSGRGLVSPTDLDVQPEGILWLMSCRADRWEQ